MRHHYTAWVDRAQLRSVGPIDCTKPIGFAASVARPPAVAPGRDSFLSIRAQILRSVQRSGPADFERAMHLPRVGRPDSEVVKGENFALGVSYDLDPMIAVYRSESNDVRNWVCLSRRSKNRMLAPSQSTRACTC